MIDSRSDHPISIALPMLLTIPEAARTARISERLLRQQIACGRGPAITRLGQSDRGKVLIRGDKLAAWIERCTENFDARKDISA